MSSTPIAHHALLSDCHAAALVDRDGTVTWWCGDRFDSPSVFGGLLDEEAGHFRLGPATEATVERRYRDGTLVLVSEFRTESGVLEVTDALVMAEGVRGHRMGLDSPHVLARRARCIEGSVDLEMEFVPRFEYGLTVPLLSPVDDGVLARGGAVCLRLSTDRDYEIEDRRVVQRFRLDAGESAEYAVEHCSAWNDVPEAWSPERILHCLDDTAEAWISWGDSHQRYEGEYADLVGHSGRVLQGLTYRPTGAMVAAATTSLPEDVGGERNWDYRYAWVRDASFTLDALWVAACPDEAETFLDFLTRAASSLEPGRDLQIVFGVGGERDLTERELPWLSGWGDSRPVRVGNGAWTQRQLDVYGEFLDAVHGLREQFEFDDHHRAFLRLLADTAASKWQEPDHGMWEVRAEPDHHLTSKLMCWVAVDRALRLADDIDATDEHRDRWSKARDELEQAILERGWNEGRQTFARTFDGDDLDAGALLVPIVGFLPADDERVLATIDTIATELVDERGLVYRYRGADGLEGEEGSFLLCTFWLAEALAVAGRVDDARDVFERAAGLVNDVALLSEEIDGPTGDHLGNTPQAFSHVGLVNAAWAITRATREAEGAG